MAFVVVVILAKIGSVLLGLKISVYSTITSNSKKPHANYLALKKFKKKKLLPLFSSVSRSLSLYISRSLKSFFSLGSLSLRSFSLSSRLRSSRTRSSYVSRSRLRKKQNYYKAVRSKLRICKITKVKVYDELGLATFE